MDLSKYIKDCLAKEIYSFSWDEIIAISDKPTSALKKELSYLISKKEVLALRQNFYLIIPPRYAAQGKLPVQLYVHKLFDYLERDYYISGYSAAKFHGASHQQIQREYITTTKPALLSITKGTVAIKFFTISNWPKGNIEMKKSDAGYFNISDPILTIVDLIYHQTKLGGLNRTLANIEELLEEVQKASLVTLLSWYPHKSVLQRLGYVMEYLKMDNDLTNTIYEHLENERFYPVLLNTAGNNKPGSVDNRWKVDVNLKLESDI